MELDPQKLPSHVAVIMDGNGRWAKKRLQNRISGHKKGAEAVRMIVRTCREIGIGYLTLYAFSTENWKRPPMEISALMELLKRFLRSEREELLTNDIRLNTIGQVDRLPPDVQSILKQVMDDTAANREMVLTLALSYGGRAEIVRMARHLAEQVQKGALEPQAIDENVISDLLYTRGIPDPDLLIRTSGEYRVSNFLLWQIAYTEIVVTDTLWPDFTRDEFFRILKNFASRERRFGQIND